LRELRAVIGKRLPLPATHSGNKKTKNVQSGAPDTLDFTKRAMAYILLNLSTMNNGNKKMALLCKRICTAITALFLFVATHAGNSGPTMMSSELQQATLDWVNEQQLFNSEHQRVVVAAGKMDSRLSFSRCTRALEFEAQQTNARSARTLIKVRCNGESPWAVFVPLEVQRFQSIVVASSKLVRGAVISEHDLEIQERTVNQAGASGFTSTEQIIGMEVKRSLRAGQAVSHFDVKPPRLVKRGDNVVIVAETGAISVKMTGTALADGYRDQQISVRNNSSDRTIRAIVLDTGIVQVLM